MKSRKDLPWSLWRVHDPAKTRTSGSGNQNCKRTCFCSFIHPGSGALLQQPRTPRQQAKPQEWERPPSKTEEVGHRELGSGGLEDLHSMRNSSQRDKRRESGATDAAEEVGPGGSQPHYCRGARGHHDLQGICAVGSGTGEKGGLRNPTARK